MASAQQEAIAALPKDPTCPFYEVYVQPDKADPEARMAFVSDRYGVRATGLIRQNKYNFWHCGNGRFYSNPIPAAQDLALVDCKKKRDQMIAKKQAA